MNKIEQFSAHVVAAEKGRMPSLSFRIQHKLLICLLFDQQQNCKRNNIINREREQQREVKGEDVL